MYREISKLKLKLKQYSIRSRSSNTQPRKPGFFQALPLDIRLLIYEHYIASLGGALEGNFHDKQWEFLPRELPSLLFASKCIYAEAWPSFIRYFRPTELNFNNPKLNHWDEIIESPQNHLWITSDTDNSRLFNILSAVQKVTSESPHRSGAYQERWLCAYALLRELCETRYMRGTTILDRSFDGYYWRYDLTLAFIDQTVSNFMAEQAITPVFPGTIWSSHIRTLT